MILQLIGVALAAALGAFGGIHAFAWQERRRFRRHQEEVRKHNEAVAAAWVKSVHSMMTLSSAPPSARSTSMREVN